MEREATLPEILDNRERRVARQQTLLAQYGKSLLCFTMNIPGPVKQNFRIRYGFLLGQQQLLDLLRSMGMPVLHRETVCAVTGCEGFYVVDAPADRLKALAASLEEGSPLGRLFDMDVITCTGQKVSRQEIGLEERTCLLCGKPARICGPVRAHSAEALWTGPTAAPTGVWISLPFWAAPPCCRTTSPNAPKPAFAAAMLLRKKPSGRSGFRDGWPSRKCTARPAV